VYLYPMIHWVCSAADEARREERRQQTSDGGCTDANGWSLPPKFRAGGDSSVAGGTQQTSIPIPVYCQPVTDDPSVQVTTMHNALTMAVTLNE